MDEVPSISVLTIEELKRQRKKSDYGFCEDCKMWFDLWKYGTLEDAGHEAHNVRGPTDEEFEECVRDCAQDGCTEQDTW